MAIVEISQAAFAALPQIDQCYNLWKREDERAWFADASARSAGVLLYNPDTKLWGYCVCLRKDDGPYSRVAVATDIPTADMARLELVAMMRKL